MDKPEGPTSADVVALVLEAVMSRLGGAATKVGHGGTLDPFASGVLVIGIGLGTRMLKNFLHGSKTYQATVRMGIETDTQDSAGTTVKTDPFDCVTREALEEVIPSYRGSIMQVPPMYSALKVKGKRLYQLAQAGKEVIRKPREVQVHALDLTSFEPPRFSLHVECGGGLYVRTLGHDLAKAVGTCGHVESLRRTAVGEFLEAECLSLEAAQDPEQIAPRLRRVAVPLPPRRRRPFTDRKSVV